MLARKTEDYNNIISYLGAYLKEERKKVPISLSTLAFRSRVSKSIIADVEKGKHSPSKEVLAGYLVECPDLDLKKVLDAMMIAYRIELEVTLKAMVNIRKKKWGQL